MEQIGGSGGIAQTVLRSGAFSKLTRLEAAVGCLHQSFLALVVPGVTEEGDTIRKAKDSAAKFYSNSLVVPTLRLVFLGFLIGVVSSWRCCRLYCQVLYAQIRAN